ncbi:MAG: 2-C-methyl-D-erythritol 2,4-cyclodiphosphate synthase [Opitutales bacterium]
MNLPSLRIGAGYDIHRLVEGRPCILGGVSIPSPVGLEGHSDADCLTHAICDALLGAAGLPDIGHFFPNADEAFRNIDSQILLQDVTGILREQGFTIINVDSTLIAEKPLIGPYREAMKATLAESMGIPIDRVGVKATTNEGVGDIGRGLAIAAHAVCLVGKED